MSLSFSTRLVSPIQAEVRMEVYLACLLLYTPLLLLALHRSLALTSFVRAGKRNRPLGTYAALFQSVLIFLVAFFRIFSNVNNILIWLPVGGLMEAFVACIPYLFNFWIFFFLIAQWAPQVHR